ncbi:MAG: flagellar hook-length control protein FliK [Hydrogenibacillus schlegelii]|nr:flagellar hook-length control protein FliK [Hydrogenibacillus schlegelii]
MADTIGPAAAVPSPASESGGRRRMPDAAAAWAAVWALVAMGEAAGESGGAEGGGGVPGAVVLGDVFGEPAGAGSGGFPSAPKEAPEGSGAFASAGAFGGAAAGAALDALPPDLASPAVGEDVSTGFAAFDAGADGFSAGANGALAGWIGRFIAARLPATAVGAGDAGGAGGSATGAGGRPASGPPESARAPEPSAAGSTTESAAAQVAPSPAEAPALAVAFASFAVEGGDVPGDRSGPANAWPPARSPAGASAGGTGTESGQADGRGPVLARIPDLARLEAAVARLISAASREAVARASTDGPDWPSARTVSPQAAPSADGGSLAGHREPGAGDRGALGGSLPLLQLVHRGDLWRPAPAPSALPPELQALVARAELLRADGRAAHLRLQLHADGLGAMDVTLKADGDRLAVVFAVAGEDARAWAERHLEALRARLIAAGWAVDRIDVAVRAEGSDAVRVRPDGEGGRERPPEDDRRRRRREGDGPEFSLSIEEGRP